MSDDQEENAHLPRRARQRLTLSAPPPPRASFGSSTKTFVQSTALFLFALPPELSIRSGRDGLI